MWRKSFPPHKRVDASPVPSGGFLPILLPFTNTIPPASALRHSHALESSWGLSIRACLVLLTPKRQEEGTIGFMKLATGWAEGPSSVFWYSEDSASSSFRGQERLHISVDECGKNTQLSLVLPEVASWKDLQLALRFFVFIFKVMRHHWRSLKGWGPSEGPCQLQHSN